MNTFLLCFIPLFVAMDVIGNLPVYMSLTSHMSKDERRPVLRMAGLTATVVGLLFMWGGSHVLEVLSVSPADFKIAGGIVLLMIAIGGVLHDDARHSGVRNEHIGVVPLGVPLMVGPATMVTLLLLAELHSTSMVSLALFANILISVVLFRFSRFWERLLHENGIRAISKIVHFFLVAIAVMMIRVGVVDIVQQLP